MATQWVGDRVAVPDIERMRRHLQEATDDVSWGPNNAFRFPVTGGTGAIWQQLSARLPRERLHFDAPVAAIRPDRRIVVTADGREFPYTALISTAPLDRLTALAGLTPLAASVAGLVRTRIWVGGVGLRNPPPPAVHGKYWMYFPEPEYPFYRVTVFSHYSRRNAPEGCYSLMTEVSSRPNDAEPDNEALMRASIEGLRRCGLIAPHAEPVHTWSYGAEYGYPVPTLGRDAVLERVLPALDAMGIHSRGRFGAWKYEVGNMDHSFMQGVEIARRLLTGANEETVWHPERVNHPNRP
jgi:protoporphyrinogen oxidase